MTRKGAGEKIKKFSAPTRNIIRRTIEKSPITNRMEEVPPMSTQPYPKKEKIAQGFSLIEKIFMGVTVYGSVIIGAHSIFLYSTIWALSYLGFVTVGMLVLFGYGLCSHCPYIYEEYTDCLFPPWGKAFRKIFSYRPEKLTLLDKLFFFTTILGIMVIPQYWLFKNYTLLILFWGFFLAMAGGFVFYECRKCQHVHCPINLTKQS